jgi:hypothetical protein
MRDARGGCLGRADRVLQPVGAGDVDVALPEAGVLDAGAIEQVEELGRVSVGGVGPCVDVSRGGELLAGFDL